jgi:hypothetical protein
MVDSSSPFELVDPSSGEDLRPLVQLMLNRWPSTVPNQDHFNVTLINNAGVSKTPTEPVEVDAGATVSLLFRAKPTVGHIADMVVVEAVDSGDAVLREDGSVRVLIPAGGVVVFSVVISVNN